MILDEMIETKNSYHYELTKEYDMVDLGRIILDTTKILY